MLCEAASGGVARRLAVFHAPYALCGGRDAPCKLRGTAAMPSGNNLRTGSSSFQRMGRSDAVWQDSSGGLVATALRAMDERKTSDYRADYSLYDPGPLRASVYAAPGTGGVKLDTELLGGTTHGVATDSVEALREEMLLTVHAICAEPAYKRPAAKIRKLAAMGHALGITFGANLPDYLLHEVWRWMELELWPARQTVIAERDTGQKMYILMDGSCESYSRSGGFERHVMRFGASFGGNALRNHQFEEQAVARARRARAALLAGEEPEKVGKGSHEEPRYENTVKTREESVLLSLSRSHFHRILKNSHDQNSNGRIEQLQKLPVFASWPAPALHQLSQSLVFSRRAKGNLLLEEDKANGKFYVVRAGVVGAAVAVDMDKDEKRAEKRRERKAKKLAEPKTLLSSMRDGGMLASKDSAARAKLISGVHSIPKSSPASSADVASTEDAAARRQGYSNFSNIGAVPAPSSKAGELQVEFLRLGPGCHFSALTALEKQYTDTSDAVGEIDLIAGIISTEAAKMSVKLGTVGRSASLDTAQTNFRHGGAVINEGRKQTAWAVVKQRMLASSLRSPYTAVCLTDVEIFSVDLSAVLHMIKEHAQSLRVLRTSSIKLPPVTRTRDLVNCQRSWRNYRSSVVRDVLLAKARQRREATGSTRAALSASVVDPTLADWWADPTISKGGAPLLDCERPGGLGENELHDQAWVPADGRPASRCFDGVKPFNMSQLEYPEGIEEHFRDKRAVGGSNSNTTLGDRFRMHDTDQGGSIDKSELTAWLHSSGVVLTQQEMDHLWSEVDVNGDCSIDFSEFMAWMQQDKSMLEVLLHGRGAAVVNKAHTAADKEQNALTGSATKSQRQREKAASQRKQEQKLEKLRTAGVGHGARRQSPAKSGRLPEISPGKSPKPKARHISAQAHYTEGAWDSVSPKKSDRHRTSRGTAAERASSKHEVETAKVPPKFSFAAVMGGADKKPRKKGEIAKTAGLRWKRKAAGIDVSGDARASRAVSELLQGMKHTTRSAASAYKEEQRASEVQASISRMKGILRSGNLESAIAKSRPVASHEIQPQAQRSAEASFWSTSAPSGVRSPGGHSHGAVSPMASGNMSPSKRASIPAARAWDDVVATAEEEQALGASRMPVLLSLSLPNLGGDSVIEGNGKFVRGTTARTQGVEVEGARVVGNRNHYGIISYETQKKHHYKHRSASEYHV